MEVSKQRRRLHNLWLFAVEPLFNVYLLYPSIRQSIDHLGCTKMKLCITKLHFLTNEDKVKVIQNGTFYNALKYNLKLRIIFFNPKLTNPKQATFFNLN